MSREYRCVVPGARKHPGSAFLVLALFAALPCLAQVPSLGVVPEPRQVTWGTGTFFLDETVAIELGQRATAHERMAAEALADVLRNECNLTLDVVAKAAQDAAAITLGRPSRDAKVKARMAALGLALTEKMRDEGYVFGVDDRGVVIGADSDAGVLYGTMTLRQMALARPAGSGLPHVRIHDWPAMKLRGIHDEISYGQVSTMANFKDMIRFLAEFKMNALGIYIEDVYRFEKYPFIGVGRGALTRAEVDELEAFAKPLNVQIIPMFEMLANQGMLLSLPEMVEYAEYPGAHSFAINEKSRKFFEDTVAELAEAFDSPYLHAGLDESWDIGFGKTEAAVKEKGRAVVHAEWYRQLHDIITKNGKQMVMYADIVLKHPEILDLVPRDIVMNDWHYNPVDRYESLDIIRDYGFEILVLPGMNNWHKIFPTMAAATTNIKHFNQEAARRGALGSLTCTWGDDGSKNLREMLYYGYAYGAETSWSPETADLASFGDRFFTVWNGPGTSNQFRAIYALLEKWPWNRPILDYFRHPFLTPAPPMEPLAKFGTEELHANRVLEDARVAEALAEEVGKIAVRRKGDADYLVFAARMHQNYATGRLLVRDLQRHEEETKGTVPTPTKQLEFLTRVAKVRQETAALKSQFKELWLRTNVPANLDYALADYDMLIAAWDEAMARVRQGKYAWNPTTPAQWTHHPAASADAPIKTACFRKTFEKPAQLRRAHIQVMGDTHVKIYVNGVEMGEQYLRRNLSAPINPNLVQIYSIGPYLDDGQNVIAVWARNYGSENQNLEPDGPAGSGGFHLYGELVDGEGRVQQLLSGDTWKANDREVAGWTETTFDDGDWPNAKGVEKSRWEITHPSFVSGRKGYCSNGRG